MGAPDVRAIRRTRPRCSRVVSAVDRTLSRASAGGLLGLCSVVQAAKARRYVPPIASVVMLVCVTPRAQSFVQLSRFPPSCRRSLGMGAERSDDRRARVPRRVPSIRLLLVVLAILPLFGVTWFGVHDLSRTRRGYDEAVAVQTMVAEYFEYASLRSAVLDERNWSMVTQGLAELGIANDVVV